MILFHFSVIGLLEEMNKTAGMLRYWSAVRYSSSLLHQMIDSISPYVTQILVNGKRVAVGECIIQVTFSEKGTKISPQTHI